MSMRGNQAVEISTKCPRLSRSFFLALLHPFWLFSQIIRMALFLPFISKDIAQENRPPGRLEPRNNCTEDDLPHLLFPPQTLTAIEKRTQTTND